MTSGAQFSGSHREAHFQASICNGDMTTLVLFSSGLAAAVGLGAAAGGAWAAEVNQPMRRPTRITAAMRARKRTLPTAIPAVPPADKLVEAGLALPPEAGGASDALGDTVPVAE